MTDLPSVNPFTDLLDAAVRYPAIKLTCCRCRHVTIVSCKALGWHCYQKGSRDDFREVQWRSVCLICWFRSGERVRTADLEFVHAEPTDTRFPEPPDLSWMHEKRRRR